MHFSKLPEEIIAEIFSYLSARERRTCRVVSRVWSETVMKSPYFRNDRVLRFNHCELSPSKTPLSYFNKKNPYKWKKVIFGMEVNIKPDTAERCHKLFAPMTELEFSSFSEEEAPVYQDVLMELVRIADFMSLKKLKVANECQALGLLKSMVDPSQIEEITLEILVHENLIANILKLCPQLKTFKVEYHNFREAAFTKLLQQMVAVLQKHPQLTMQLAAPNTFNLQVQWHFMHITSTTDVTVDTRNHIATRRMQLFRSNVGTLQQALKWYSPELQEIIVSSTLECYMSEIMLKPSVRALFLEQNFKYNCYDCFRMFIKCFPNLTTLKLEAPSIGFETIACIPWLLPNLRYLSVDTTFPDFDDLQCLTTSAVLPNLEVLELRGMVYVKEQDIKLFSVLYPKLKYLILVIRGFCSHVSRILETCLRYLPNLEHLNLQHMMMTQSQAPVMFDHEVLKVMRKGLGKSLKTLVIPRLICRPDRMEKIFHKCPKIFKVREANYGFTPDDGVFLRAIGGYQAFKN